MKTRIREIAALLLVVAVVWPSWIIDQMATLHMPLTGNPGTGKTP